MQNIKFWFMVLALVAVLGGALADVSLAATKNCPGANPITGEVKADGTHDMYYPDGTPAPSCPTGTAAGLVSTLSRIFNTLFTFMLVIASFVILWAGFIYLTAEGEAEKTTKAKNMMVYAVIALVIAALAWGAPKIVQNFVAGA